MRVSRWRVLFGVNLMNFFDRQIVGALAEPIRLEFGLSDTRSASSTRSSFWCMRSWACRSGA